MDIDALIKLIRLIANLFTLEEIGLDFVQKRATNYKELLRKLNDLINKKDVKKHAVSLAYFGASSHPNRS